MKLNFCLAFPLLKKIIDTPLLSLGNHIKFKKKDLQKGAWKITKNLLITYLIAFIALSAVGIGFLFNPWSVSKTDAAWFNDNWAFRKRIDITVTSTGSDILQLDTLLTVDTTGITANLQTNCQDLRFTDISGNILQYYIDSCNDNSSTNKIWVRAPLVPKNTTVYTMYMYYGNASVAPATYLEMVSLYSGLEGYWTGNESSWNGTSGEVKDSSVNGNNGTSSGGITTTSAKYSSSGDWDSTDDSVTMGSPTVVDNLPANGMTLSTWIFPDTLGQSGVGFITSKNTGSGQNQGWFLLNYTNNTLQFVVDGSTDLVVQTSNDSITLGAWNHVVLSWDGNITTANSVRIYVNGREVGYQVQTNGAGRVDDAASGLYIGNSSAGNRTFDGKIDDHRLYSRALSPLEAFQLYQNPGSITTTATATSNPSTSFASEEKGPTANAYWKFDEDQGQTVYDSVSSNASNGTLGANTGSSTDDPAWRTDDLCTSGSCLLFDGGDYIPTADKDMFSPSSNTNMTISVWAKVPQTAAAVSDSTCGGNGAYIITKGGASSDYEWGLENAGNAQICFNTWQANGSTHLGTNTGTMIVNDGNWHYYVATVSYGGAGATTVEIYVDGVRKSGGTGGSGTMSNGGTTLQVGRRGDAGSTYFSGFIDEPKIYSQVLTASQILSNYNARSNPEGVSMQAGNNNQNMTGALSNGLAGYWKLDETSAAATCSGTPVLDSSANGLNANACPNSTGPSRGVAAKYANGVTFDGSNDYLDVADPASGSLDFSASDSFTLSAWIKRSDINIAGLVIGKTVGSLGYKLAVTDNAGGNAIRMFISDGSNDYDIKGTTTLVNTTTNWYHVAMVVQGRNNASLYVNGVQQALTVTSGTLSTVGSLANTGAFNIGGFNASERFAGSIDEARVYNRALSGNDIKQLSNWAPGPAAYWDFESKAGQTVYDKTPNANDFTLGSSSSDESIDPFWVPGKYGSALKFDGSTQYAQGTAGSSLLLTNGITISAWIKVEGGTGSYRSIVLLPHSTTTWGSPYAKWGIQISDTNVFRFLIQEGGTLTTLAGTSTISTTSGWVHVAATYDKANLRVFVNGVQENISPETFDMTTTTVGNLSLGVNNATASSGKGEYFWGQIDEVKVYNYARSQSQIIEDINGGHPAPGSPVGSPIAWWKINEQNDNMCIGGTNDICNSGSAGTTLDGTLTASSRTTAGRNGSAYNGAGGATRGSIADSALLDFTASEDFTISAWIKSDATTNPSANNQWIVSKRTSVTDIGYALYVNSSGQFCFGIDDDATSFPEDSTCGTADIFDSAGVTWHHVTAKKTGTTRLDVYVDGKPSGTPDTSISATGTLANTGIFYIADQDADNNATANEEEFFGDIDDVKVYRSALTDAQVAMDMNQASAQVLGSISSSQANQNSAAAEFCIPGDATACTAPLHQFRFNEGRSTTANDIGSTINNGVLGSGVTYAPGKAGWGVSSTGVSGAAVSNAAELYAETGTFTIEAWIKVNSLASDAIIMGDNDTNSTSFYASSSNGFTNALVYCFTGDCSPVGTDTGSSTNNALTLGVWQHVAMTYNGSNTCTFHVNGVVVTSDASCSETSAAYTTYIGAETTGASAPIQIDEVRTYNYVRTPAQIAWTYNQGEPIVHLKMDECQGTILNDVSGLGMTGTWTGTGAGTTSVGTCATSSTAWGNGVSGRKNFSLDFDGTDDQVSITNADIIDFDIGLRAGSTFAAWIYVDSDGENDLGHVFSKDGGSPSQTYIRVGGESGGTVQVAAAMDLGTADGTIAGSASTAITTGAWHHVAMGYSDDGDDEISLYIDGVRRGLSTNGSGAPTTSDSSNLIIGNQNAATDRTFDGKIDDFRIYGYELNATLIKTLYNQGVANYGPTVGAP